MPLGVSEMAILGCGCIVPIVVVVCVVVVLLVVVRRREPRVREAQTT